MGNKIIPHLWYDDQAEEAAGFYAGLFEDGRILHVARYGPAAAQVSGRPEGSVMTVSFQLAGQSFMALNAGPMFSFTPAISFFVDCGSEEEIEDLWAGLGQDGTVLMELGEYPFSRRFGWVQDRYGVSWQLNLDGGGQKITPFLLFTGEQQGRAEEAMKLYVSLFQEAGILQVVRHGPEQGEEEGTVLTGSFTLEGQKFMAMDSGLEHPFTFTPAVSLLVNCAGQGEVDLLWNGLGEGGALEECGWLRDRFGVSWQIVPAVLDRMMEDPDPVARERVMEALLKMGKLDEALLKKAYGGEL
ncbi:VOC family protein [Anaerotalea alkaliphila]|uniref:VOC family protein n=1 Tax=Anaerotalea alkaliphila TaxID=2662126 RepID=A0A7X5KPM6_9FIRM|nr:VOC family protein [Anaerotalea alkaliphila]NDL68372.1 VOC family protein [Anaerotalea alkaliphila]